MKVKLTKIKFTKLRNIQAKQSAIPSLSKRSIIPVKLEVPYQRVSEFFVSNFI